ncbi:GntP family permease [Allofournierella sp.]|uniref:GntP family permease n=1 Tax=Allofournierella sp. TaxID=1940256 RepID=UPI003AB87DAE
MNALGIIGLLLGIVILIVVSYKGFSAVPTTMLAGAVVMILNGVNLWTGYSTMWIGGLAGVFTSYYLLFLVSTFFANVMQATGACTTVAYKFVDWFGKKHILTVLTVFCFLLCYGGVSFFVVMFAVSPIAFSLFAELNIPRKMIMLPVAAGAGAFVLAVPGSTQLSNVIPTALGTSLMAAPAMGFLICILGMAISFVYVEKVYKKTMLAVEAGTEPGWVPDSSNAALRARGDVPGITGGFLPLLFVIAFIVAGSFIKFIENATLLAVLAMLIGSVLAIALNLKFIEGSKMAAFKEMLTKSATGAAGSALTLGAIVGFGTIVSNTASFTSIVEWLMNLNMSPYWKGVISTGALAGVCGSASSGAKLTMDYLGEYFINSGCNLEVLHRLIANASITFDSLPHATGCFLMLSYFGLNHKIGYKHVFWLDTVIPLALVIVFTFACTLLF